MEVDAQQRRDKNPFGSGFLAELEEGHHGTGDGLHQEHPERSPQGDEGAQGVGVEGSVEGSRKPKVEDQEGLNVQDDVRDEEGGKVKVAKEEEPKEERRSEMKSCKGHVQTPTYLPSPRTLKNASFTEYL